MLYVKPTREVTLQAAQKGLNEELSALASDGITFKELQRIKKVPHQTRATLLRPKQEPSLAMLC